MSERFRGLPSFDPSRCPDKCSDCVSACPTKAIRRAAGAALELDLGRCLFCADCTAAYTTVALAFGGDHRLVTRNREDLVLRGPPLALAAALEQTTRRLFGRSLCLRQVSEGSFNAREADSDVLTTIGWDIGRFGIRFIASPRHADGLLVTGPVTRNMELALEKTWEAVASPKIVIAVGACAISGGLYAGSHETLDGAASTVTVDLFVPECPPHPLTILDGMLRLLGRFK